MKPSDFPCDRLSDVPSDMPSDAQSRKSSDRSSYVPSDKLSYMPSNLSSNRPSDNKTCDETQDWSTVKSCISLVSLMVLPISSTECCPYQVLTSKIDVRRTKVKILLLQYLKITMMLFS